ncbi:hypothetical protein BMG03_17030 [Thioclava nitratireducens]|uniref:Uncharacterized protein n=1 Tax=Thioclava nitratireducens TaxID=1915078 RepID=A0ABM6IKT3_9RHOB|nr:hypothetical protein [Thioclava nitratireducens]AQS49305.1 hypothetical protein BMG03_17030 [Thioclava nitratireducens]
MTVQIPQTKRDAIFNEYCRIQDKITKVAEKEHKAQLRRRRYVLDAFGKWLDKAPRSEVETFLETLSDASSVADSKRIADYLNSLPPEPESTAPVARSTIEAKTDERA